LGIAFVELISCATKPSYDSAGIVCPRDIGTKVIGPINQIRQNIRRTRVGFAVNRNVQHSAVVRCRFQGKLESLLGADRVLHGPQRALDCRADICRAVCVQGHQIGISCAVEIKLLGRRHGDDVLQGALARDKPLLVKEDKLNGAGALHGVVVVNVERRAQDVVDQDLPARNWLREVDQREYPVERVRNFADRCADQRKNAVVVN